MWAEFGMMIHVRVELVKLSFDGKEKQKRKLRGTSGSDELTGLISNQRIYGLAGDDIISTVEGKFKVWGGKGRDTFVTLNGGDGYLQVMDFEVGDKIQFCGCASTRIEQKGRNAWIVKSNDVKAVLRGVDADELHLDFTQGLIAFAADS
jgi:Ca2+-binding RTX toxin-like protein